MNLTIELPFPDGHLMPNAARRMDYRARAGYAQTARLNGFVEAANAGRNTNFGKEVSLSVEIVFCEPNKRTRDIDGMLSAIKPMLDGIADALEVNDKQFNPIVLRRGDVCKGGKVIVSLQPDGELAF